MGKLSNESRKTNSFKKPLSSKLLSKYSDKNKTNGSGLNGKIIEKKNSPVSIDVSDFDMSDSKDQLRQLLAVTKAVRKGDFSVRMPQLKEGLISEIGEVLNDIIEMNENMADEFARVRNTVGQEGKMTERVSMGSVKGAWSASVDSINLLIGDLVQPTTEVARVITSVAKGDLSQKMSLEIDGRAVKGAILRIGTTVNSIV